MKPLHVVALTGAGAETAARLASGMGGSLHLPAKYAGAHPEAVPFDEPFASLLARLWPGAGGFLLVMAAGIAVRSAAQLLRSKYEDPALVVLDPPGRFAVPILSGHLGGANDLARRAAELLGGSAVITTATDAAGAPAIEVWARDRSLAPENPKRVASVNSALADGMPVALFTEPELRGLELGALGPRLDLITSDPAEFDSFSGARVAVTHRHPGPGGALLLRPRVLVLGMGARRDADADRAVTEIPETLRNKGYSELSASSLATIDLKKGEPAVVAVAKALGVPLVTFSASELASVEVPNPSRRVLEAVGSPAVAEPAALLASGAETLLIEKTAGKDWTLAAALKKDN